MTAAELVDWLASLPPSERDAAVEAHLGIDASEVSSAPPGENLVGYHPSGLASIVEMLVEVPVEADDVVVDLGAGLGKVALITRLFTGAVARGVEIQPALVECARRTALRLDIDATFVLGDARDAPLDDATVFYLYTPFTGAVLRDVLERLRVVASRRQIVVCALAVDLDREAPWLARRKGDSFWLAIYDSTAQGATPRPRGSHLASTLARLCDTQASVRPR